jgi:hypothetical protein
MAVVVVLAFQPATEAGWVPGTRIKGQALVIGYAGPPEAWPLQTR